MVRGGDCAQLLRAADEARAHGEPALAKDLADGCSKDGLVSLAAQLPPAEALLLCGRAKAAGAEATCGRELVVDLAGKLHPRIAIGVVAAFTQLPQHCACACAVFVVDFQDPVLMPHGKQQIALFGQIDKSVGMRPVGESHGMAIHVEMVECGPHPCRIEVRIQVHDSVAENGGLPGKTREIGEIFIDIDQQEQMAIGQNGKIVVDGVDGPGISSLV